MPSEKKMGKGKEDPSRSPAPVPRQKGSRSRHSGTGILDILDRFFNRAYRLAYYTGAQIVRRERRLGRRLEVGFDRMRDKQAEHRKKRMEAMGRSFKRLLRSKLRPILTINKRLHEYNQNLRVAWQAGTKEWAMELLRTAGSFLYAGWRALMGLLNYAAPICAVWLLIATIQHFTNLTFALAVEYGGQTIGYISQETVFENAETEVKKRIVADQALVTVIQSVEITDNATQSQDSNEPQVSNEENDSQQVSQEQVAQAVEQMLLMPKYTLTVVDRDLLSDVDTLTDRIIQVSGSEIVQASGLYIGDEFKGASTDPDAILDEMNAMLEQYDTGDISGTPHFVSKIALKDGLYPTSTLRTTEEFRTLLNGNVSGESYYTIEEGDDPWGISEKTGLPLGELQSMNPEMEDNFFPGEQLLISRSVPMMKVQVTRREVYDEDIPYETEYVDNAKLIKGLENVKESGVPGTMEVTADVTYVDGVEVSRTILKEERVSEPQNRVIERGTNIPTTSGQQSSGGSSSSSGFIWPVGGTGGYLSMPIWGYAGHTGTDIAAGGVSGLPILASASGRVVVARQNYGGYGRYIMIDHGNNIQTLYAHNSQLLVSVGDYVQQGQVIAIMGMTGNATGVHCHFEIRQNGAYLDARNYIGYSSPY